MINRLEKVVEAERQVTDRRSASKIRYQEIQSEFRKKSQNDIEKLEQELMDKRQVLFDEAHEQALHDKHDIDAMKEDQISKLKSQFELRKEDVKNRIIQEVFGNGNR